MPPIAAGATLPPEEAARLNFPHERSLVPPGQRPLPCSAGATCFLASGGNCQAIFILHPAIRYKTWSCTMRTIPLCKDFRQGKIRFLNTRSRVARHGNCRSGDDSRFQDSQLGRNQPSRSVTRNPPVTGRRWPAPRLPAIRPFPCAKVRENDAPAPAAAAPTHACGLPRPRPRLRARAGDGDRLRQGLRQRAR